jgi:hypothetical protein
MVAGDVIHSVAGSNFRDYYYYEILIPNGVAATINGVVLPAMAAPITVPVGVSNAGLISGAVFLIGRKKFGATSGTSIGTWENPLSNDPGNSVGTFSIK